jgi:hypothetical protein
MAQKKKSPRRHAGASRKLEQNPTTTFASVPEAVYWTRVEDDGTEVRFDRDPNYRSLRVELIDLGQGRMVEQTKTWCREECQVYHETYGYCMVCIYPVRPRGRGWRLHDNASDKFTVWRRAHAERGVQ